MVIASLTLVLFLRSTIPGSFQDSGAPSSAEAKRVPGTSVSLVPPEGFTPAATFSGFQHLESRSSIMVSSLAAPFEKVSPGFKSGVSMKRQGLTLLSFEDHPHQDGDGLLLHASQVAQGMAVEKWIWVLETGEDTTLVVGLCMEDALEEMRDTVRAAVLTASYDPNDAGDLLDGLGFTIEDPGSLKLLARMANTLAYSEDGKPDAAKAGKAIFVIGPAIALMPTTDAREFALSRVKGAEGAASVEVTSEREIEIDGLVGLELIGSCTRDGKPAAFYQAFLQEGVSYWLAQGFVRSVARERFLREFRRATHSLRRDRIVVAASDGTSQITVPGTWAPVQISEIAEIQVGQTAAGCFALVMSESKALLSDRMTLATFAEATRSNLTTAESRPLREFQSHGRNAIQTVFPNAEDDVAYIHTAIEGEDHYHQIVAWMMASLFHRQRNILDEVIESFQGK